MTDNLADKPFNKGGWIPGGPTRVTLDAAECVVRAADVLAGTPVCCRRDPAHTEARP